MDMPVYDTEPMAGQHCDKRAFCCIERTPHHGTGFQPFHDWVYRVSRCKILIIFVELVLDLYRLRLLSVYNLIVAPQWKYRCPQFPSHFNCA